MVALVLWAAFGNAYAQAAAGLFISATRLVFSSGARDASLQIYNENSYPVVVQTWVDAGDIESDPTLIDVPFVILPPIMRLQANEARAIRIVYSQQPLPTDRESVFWFNAQMIPPRPPGDRPPNVVDVSVRIRQKIFFRPKQLTGGSDAWMASLQCRVTDQEAQAVHVACQNPSPYFATLDHLALHLQEGEYIASGDMLAPFGSRDFTLNKESAKTGPDAGGESQLGKLTVTAIDDAGHLTRLFAQDNGKLLRQR